MFTTGTPLGLAKAQLPQAEYFLEGGCVLVLSLNQVFYDITLTAILRRQGRRDIWPGEGTAWVT